MKIREFAIRTIGWLQTDPPGAHRLFVLRNVLQDLTGWDNNYPECFTEYFLRSTQPVS